MPFEKMEVAVPEKLDIKASGVVIGTMERVGNNPNAFSIVIDQKTDILTLGSTLINYWEGQKKKVKSIVADNDPPTTALWYTVYTEDVYTPRIIKDNPQA